MRHPTVLALLAAGSLAATTVPEVGVGTVLRPTFTLNDGKSFEAGTAFPLNYGESTFVLTAIHLFGPNGGQPAQLTPEQVVANLKEARLVDAFGQQAVGAPTGGALLVPGAHPMGADAKGDLVVLTLRGGLEQLSIGTTAPLRALNLAAADAKVGDPIWLAASLSSGPEADLKLHPAKVAEVNPSWIFYDFTGGALDLRATSGAPLLNADGEVVGMHLGGGVKDNKTFGAGGPASAMRANLAAATKK